MALHAPLPLHDRGGFRRIPGRGGPTGRYRRADRGREDEMRGTVAPRPAPMPPQTVGPDAREATASLRLTPSGVAVLLLVTAAAGVLLVAGTTLAADGGATPRTAATTLEAGGGSRSPHTVVVEPGGSLWGVAVRHAPEDSDLRAYVADLERVNGVSAAEVRAGMALRLPAR